MSYKIKVICAYCKQILGEKDSQHPGDTHTVCPVCLAEQNRLLAILVEETEQEQAIPFMGEPMPNREVTVEDYYGL